MMHLVSHYWMVYIILTWCCLASGFSWERRYGTQDALWEEPDGGSVEASPLDVSLESSGLTNRYDNTLRDLQRLQSEPLCHRIAAKLLVNSCQVLDGHDEATALTDTGRAARDFVDFYAASLAICDLERGSFSIPHDCASFREDALQKVPTPKKAQLHVTGGQINDCLQGLAKSDSAWNTWVSYRHKALRFCEAARKDHEKDQNIFLYQRLTRILESLTASIERDIAEQLRSLDRMFQEATSRVEDVLPHFDQLQHDVKNLKTEVIDSLSRDAKGSAASIRDGLDRAQVLQETLVALVHTIQQQRADLISTHDNSLQISTQHLSDSLGVVLTSLSDVAAMSNSVLNVIERSSERLQDISHRQAELESGMGNLEHIAGHLAEQQQHQQQKLEQSQTTASAILQTLESVSSTAGTVHSSYLQGQTFSQWLPIVLGPGVALVLGSYGLPPSIGRNLLLIGLGEAIGIAASAYQSHHSHLAMASEPHTWHSSSLNHNGLGNQSQQMDDEWCWETY